ncbi:Uncharacterised protein [Vibrio cholerae]|nr:Uncharacterised protein [Vibrio cholerae]
MRRRSVSEISNVDCSLAKACTGSFSLTLLMRSHSSSEYLSQSNSTPQMRGFISIILIRSLSSTG